MLNTELITYNSPPGKLYIAICDAAVIALSFTPLKETHISSLGLPDFELLPGKIENLVPQLDMYFSGSDPDFSIPVRVRGSFFEREVWKACTHVPYGKTSSYRQLAEAIGKPGAARAVGNALSKNFVPILIPCHRIIRSDGQAGGFGGGPALKEILLNIEKER
jgi:O-6-methylguanine DNA methyltransferase